MKAMIHNLSRPAKRILSGVLAFVMVFGVLFFVSPDSVSLTAHAMMYDGEYGYSIFTENDRICVENTLRTTKNTAVFTTDDGMTWTTEDDFVWNSSTENQFNAWYPAADYASFNSFTIPTDQSSGVKLESADWMTIRTDAMAKPADGNLDLHFQHRLAKVTVKIVAWSSEYNGEKQDIWDVKMYSKGSALTATYDADGSATVTPVDTNLTEITPLSQSSKTEFTALVVPTKYESTDKLMTFTANDEDALTVFAGGNATLLQGLEAGKHYNFELTVGSDGIVLSAVTVADYAGPIEVEGGVAEEVAYELTDEMVSLEYEDVVYTGEIFTPEVTVIADGTVLTKDTDYTVEYGPNMDPGWGIVTVTGKGRWTGTVTKQFMIAPRS